MRVLITGASGFAGRHLIQELLNAEDEAVLFGTAYQSTPTSLPEDITIYPLDLCDEQACDELIAEVKPDHIYHLAAQSSPFRSLSSPWPTLENNIKGQLNIILACLRSGIQPRILVVSSAEIYCTEPPECMPLTETSELRPTTPYSLSKIAQDMMGLQYFVSHNLPVLRARPFNHIGPGQSDSFVAADFATQIARVEQGLQEPIIRVGNLSVRRDFTDVRDVVRAYRLLMQYGQPGEAYNIASGKAHSIRELLEALLSLSDAQIEVQVDPARLRPVNAPVVQGDFSRLKQATGWEPRWAFRESLRAVLEDCRQRVQESQHSR